MMSASFALKMRDAWRDRGNAEQDAIWHQKAVDRMNGMHERIARADASKAKYNETLDRNGTRRSYAGMR